MASGNASDKKTIRSEMRRLLMQNLPHRDRLSRGICTLVQEHPAWKNARTVGLFSPLPEEPNLLELLAASDKRFFFPCVQGADLEWRAVRAYTDLRAGARLAGRTLLEPPVGPGVSVDTLECLLVPGLAFTACGQRLGRGGGYYDRALSARHRESSAIGICFTFQVRESLPVEPHDLPVDTVLHSAG